MYLFLDTETTGVPAGGENIHMVELAWVLTDGDGNVRASADFIVKPEGFVIPAKVAELHGVTQERALVEGYDLVSVLTLLLAVLQFPVSLVGHNIGFDVRVLRKEFDRLNWQDLTHGLETLDTMRSSTDICDIRPPSLGGKLKAPKLGELYRRLFPEEEDYVETHHAMDDTLDMMKCFWELRRLEVL
jgi:DNA polymerase III epsilon subunit-like protein